MLSKEEKAEILLQEIAEIIKEKPPKDLLEKKVKELLTSVCIDYSKWGKGNSRTFDDFLRELVRGESKLSLDSKGKLLRTVSIACIDITYRDLKLIEERQVFEDGRVRIRGLSATVTEKILPEEDPEKAALRGLEEELGIINTDTFNAVDKKESLRIESPSYPGVRSRYIVHHFEATIDSNEYQPEGYIEQNKDEGLTAFFKWKRRD